MKCPKCGAPNLQETSNVEYGGKKAYYCIVCGFKTWMCKAPEVMYKTEQI